MSSYTGDNTEEEKKLYIVGRTKRGRKKIQTHRATVDRREKKRINKVRTTGRCITIYSYRKKE